MNLIERLELVLDESRKNDDLALNLLVKAGVGKTIAPEVLKALGAITVDGGDNSKRVVDMSKNGKDIIPLAVWMGSVWDANDTLELNINKVADQVHRKGAMPALENVDFTTIMTNNGGEEGKLDTLDKLTQWLDKQGAKTKNVSKGGSGYNFPKEMLAYSDDVVDCYRADTPTEAMMLGSGYPFCISRRDGSNFFYSYRMNPTTTTVYFCWFKDEHGNKSHDDMVVVHVGDDGKYMVTLAKNGSFPRDSKATTIEKYPRLKGAIESGKLTVVPMGDDEREVRQKYNARSILGKSDLKGKKPSYIELILSQGVCLKDDAFDYIFNTIDKGNLRTGNNGNSLIKKYVETGIHELTPFQRAMLREAGYENEVARAFETYWRGRVEARDNLSDEVFEELFTKIYKNKLEEGSVIKRYIDIGKYNLTDKQEQLLIDAGYKDVVLKVLEDYLNQFGERGVSVYATSFKKVFNLIDKGDITKENSVCRRYLENMINSHNSPDILKYNIFEKGTPNYKIYSAYFVAAMCMSYNHMGKVHLIKEGDKYIMDFIDSSDTLSFHPILNTEIEGVFYTGINNIAIIKGVKNLSISYVDFNKVEKFPYVEGLVLLHTDGVRWLASEKLSNTEIDTISIDDIQSRVNLSGTTARVFRLRGTSRWTNYSDDMVIAPKNVKSLESSYVVGSGLLKSLPRTVDSLTLELPYSNVSLKGIPEMVRGDFFLYVADKKHLSKIAYFPKKIEGQLVLDYNASDSRDSYLTNESIPKCIRDCDVKEVSLNGYSRSAMLSKDVAQFLIQKNTKVFDLDQATHLLSDKRGLVEKNGKVVATIKKQEFPILNWNKQPDIVRFDVPKNKFTPMLDFVLELNKYVKLNNIPEKIEVVRGKSLGHFNISLRIKDSYYEELTLDHDVEGITMLSIKNCRWLKEIRGVEHFKGLKWFFIENCPKLDLKQIKAQLPEDVKTDFFNARDESLTTLHTVLNALSEEDAPVGDAGTGSTTGTVVGNGTVSDLGEVPEPKLALLNVPYKKRKKGIKGLIALLSSKSER